MNNVSRTAKLSDNYGFMKCDSDVFKLRKRQQIPVFVSEKFKKLIELEMITGISLTEIAVAED